MLAHCQPAGGSRDGVSHPDRKERPKRMNFTAFVALVRRDLRLFFLDKRAMTMSFLAPILIGSFFGYLFGGVTRDRTPSKIAVTVVDHDGSAISKRVVAALGNDKSLAVDEKDLQKATESVRA